MSTKSHSRESFKRNTFKSKLGTVSLDLNLNDVVTGLSAPLILDQNESSAHITSTGTQIYGIVGSSSTCTIYLYTSSDPFGPVSGFTYQQSFPFSVGGNKVLLNLDGTKLYIFYREGSNGSKVSQYSLSSAFDLSTASLDFGNEKINETYIGNRVLGEISMISFSPDGKNLYLVDPTYENLYQLELTTPWDIRTKVSLYSFFTGADTHNCTGIRFSTDGLKMFTALDTGNIEEYELSSPFKIGTATKRANIYLKDGLYTSVSRPNAFDFSADGKKLYFCVSAPNDYIVQMNLANAFDLTSAEYVNYPKTLNTDSYGHVSPKGVFVGNSGSSMYVTQWTSGPNIVRQLNMSDPYNPNTASNVAVLTISDEIPSGIYVGNSGHSLYVSGQDLDRIFQFNMSTAWDLNTATLANINAGTHLYSTGTSQKKPDNYDAITFNPDGTQIIISDTVCTPYRLSTPWDLSTIINYGLRTNPLFTDPSGFTFKPDGTALYISQGSRSNVYQYSLPVPWEENSAVFEKHFSVVPQITTETGVTGLEFSADGSNLYVSGTVRDNIYQWTLNTPWDIGTANTFVSNINLVSITANPAAPRFSPDGTRLFVLSTTADLIDQFDLAIPWMVSTATEVFSYSVASLDGTPTDIRFGNNGHRLYVIGTTNDNPRQLILGDAYDLRANVSSAPASTQFTGLGEATPQGIYVRPDGRKAYTVGTTRDAVASFFLANVHDISTGNFGLRISQAGSFIYRGLSWSNTGTSIFVTTDAENMLQLYTSNVEHPFDLTYIDFSVGRKDIPHNDMKIFGASPDFSSITSDNRYIYVSHEDNDTIRRYEFKDPSNPRIDELLGPAKLTPGTNLINGFDVDDILTIPDDDSNIIMLGVATGNNPIVPSSVAKVSMLAGNVWNMPNNVVSYLDPAPFDSVPTCIEFFDNGNRMIISGDQREQGNVLLLSTPYDPASYTGVEGNVLTFTSELTSMVPTGLFVDSNFEYLYVANQTRSIINRYKLNTANSLLGATTRDYPGSGIKNLTGFDTFASDVGPVGMTMNSDGTRFLICMKNNTGTGTLVLSSSNVLQMETSFPYDIGSANFSGQFVGPLSIYGQYQTIDFQAAADGRSIYLTEIWTAGDNRFRQIYLIDKNVLGI